ncbi:MAG TPA: imidazole glycerol phosphate synthase subunit HisH [Myxococcales bacterium]|nr:imidazole glycerol phosphate synthase subunit HisH [Myxococcales bacterium]
MKRVLLVDTSMGNLRSVARALDRAGAEVTLSADPEAVRGADRVVVPGQGHFRDCAKALAGGLGEALRAHVDAGRPYLGICLGMQILFERSEEAEDVAGLGLFPGAVRRFADDLVDSDGRALKVPHMGWNVVRGAHPLLDPEAWLYFVHSYHCVPADPSLTVGTAEYGAPFCAAIAKDNVFACQFHPEKSQRAGARVLERFLEDAWS